MNGEKALLLVEDDVVDMMSVKRALRELKIPNPLYHVENGEEALAWLNDTKNPRPAIILLDLNMPRMNGHEFLAIIKSDAELRRIPVIVLTTSQAEADKVQSYDRGVAGYMIKTPDYPQFVKTMKTIHQYWTTSELPG
jgi:CheY-like chemotaxis protein